MSTSDFSLDDFLLHSTVGECDIITTPDGKSVEASELYPMSPGDIDPRILNLSYSSLLALHTCPRKFELDKKQTKYKTEDDDKTTLTFAFGHLIGDGIARIFVGESWERIVFQAFLDWPVDLFAEDAKADKSFWSGLLALKKFHYMRESGFLSNYQVLYYQGKPAVELSFKVSFPDGFMVRGFVDVVLQEIYTGEIVVIECKSTGMTTINPATYKNSAQGIGYSVVLDVVAPETSSYQVYYLVYKTKGQEFEILPFTKTYLQRALWIKEILLDIEMLKLYAAPDSLFPMHGESCVQFFRDCKYLNTCQLSTDYLTSPPTYTDLDTKEYEINLSLLDLIDAQLKKANPHHEHLS